MEIEINICTCNVGVIEDLNVYKHFMIFMAGGYTHLPELLNNYSYLYKIHRHKVTLLQ